MAFGIVESQQVIRALNGYYGGRQSEFIHENLAGNQRQTLLARPS